MKSDDKRGRDEKWYDDTRGRMALEDAILLRPVAVDKGYDGVRDSGNAKWGISADCRGGISGALK